MERPLSRAAGLDRVLHQAEAAAVRWRKIPLEERASLCAAWIDAIL